MFSIWVMWKTIDNTYKQTCYNEVTTVIYILQQNPLFTNNIMLKNKYKAEKLSRHLTDTLPKAIKFNFQQLTNCQTHYLSLKSIANTKSKQDSFKM